MHYSNYNHLVKSGESTWKLHNFLTGKTIDLDPFGLAFFNTALEQDESSPVFQKLKSLGFIVDYDELSFIRTVANSASGMSCKVLPICLGGCVNARLTGRRRCNRARFDPDSYVLNIEEINKRKKEGEQNDEYQQTD